MLNKPVIARIHVFTHNWCLIIGYDDVRDAVYLRLANGTIWVSNWYELCEEIVLFAKKRYSETANLTREQYKGMYSNYTHMLPDDFSMGEQAFYDWKKLFELKVSEQAVLDYSCFLFRQLQKNRTLMAQMIIEWHGNHTAAGIACLRHLKLLLQQLEKICNIIALERRECLTAIDCVSTIDVNILKEWEHYLADTNINNAPFQNDIITKNKAERSEK